ncbi:lactate utilization protein [Hydrogenoanaerobacterium sp.]|uniref:lactate utilization protein n=1 Tax=Hydrogenoanaerobacterium sp. TaxID=2953763 RepID=UPI00289A806E|nr:lactate utilization protein [Hydrogenoanaerobacterium sp.]
MDQNARKVMEKRIKKTIAALEKNNMMGIYVERKEDVPAKVAELLRDGSSVAFGGSMSLEESGVMELLRSGRYHLIDRDRCAPEDKPRVQREAFFADAFLCSSNAVTENGELYNVDGIGNRTAAIVFGPESVIMVVGSNKLCKNLDDAAVRVKTIAAPANCERLNCTTYCHEKGECVAFASGNSCMTSGCSSEGRICCTYVVCAQQRIKNRIKVILVGEELGY